MSSRTCQSTWFDRAAAAAAVAAACHPAGGRSISSDVAFSILQGAVQAAQAQVLAADGTLTTLVGAVVLQQRMRSKKHCCLSVVIGDSPSYVWRAAGREVDELNYQPPLHGFHRWVGRQSLLCSVQLHASG
jgi:hypothetical protein